MEFMPIFMVFWLAWNIAYLEFQVDKEELDGLFKRHEQLVDEIIRITKDIQDGISKYEE